MHSMIRSSALAAVLLFTLAPAAIAGPCPQPPFHVCNPFSVSGAWYSDATKTIVVGGWYHSCPDVETCLGTTTVWGQRTSYSAVDCEPCTPCGNCLAKKSGDDEEHEHDAKCIRKVSLEPPAAEETSAEETAARETAQQRR